MLTLASLQACHLEEQRGCQQMLQFSRSERGETADPRNGETAEIAKYDSSIFRN